MATVGLLLLTVSVFLGSHIYRFLTAAYWVGDKYTLFVDLLIFIIVLMGTIGVGIFLSIRRLTKEAVEKDMVKRFSNMKGRLDITRSVMHYQQALVYKELGKQEEARRDLERAIGRVELALDENLGEVDEIWAKSDLGYYYAEAQMTGKKDKALELTELGYKMHNPRKPKFNQPHWVDNYVYVKVRFADAKQKQELKEWIKDLLSKPDLASVKSYLEDSLKSLDDSSQEAQNSS